MKCWSAMAEPSPGVTRVWLDHYELKSTLPAQSAREWNGRTRALATESTLAQMLVCAAAIFHQ
jgi:hypothetical protein